MNTNQLLKEKREAMLPQRKYPCPCQFKCERLGGVLGECENCGYCGTDGGDQYRSIEDRQHYELSQ